MKHFKSALFKLAHSVKNNFSSFSEALRFAWKVIKLRKDLTLHNVRFSYRKIDGSIRQAVGTLNLEDYEHKSEKRSSPAIFTYYDIEKKAFRSCKTTNLIF